jgi:hypothetical protein
MITCWYSSLITGIYYEQTVFPPLARMYASRYWKHIQPPCFIDSPLQQFKKQKPHLTYSWADLNQWPVSLLVSLFVRGIPYSEITLPSPFQNLFRSNVDWILCFSFLNTRNFKKIWVSLTEHVRVISSRICNH